MSSRNKSFAFNKNLLKKWQCTDTSLHVLKRQSRRTHIVRRAFTRQGEVQNLAPVRTIPMLTTWPQQCLWKKLQAGFASTTSNSGYHHIWCCILFMCMHSCQPPASPHQTMSWSLTAPQTNNKTGVTPETMLEHAELAYCQRIAKAITTQLIATYGLRRSPGRKEEREGGRGYSQKSMLRTIIPLSDQLPDELDKTLLHWNSYCCKSIIKTWKLSAIPTARPLIRHSTQWVMRLQPLSYL